VQTRGRLSCLGVADSQCKLCSAVFLRALKPMRAWLAARMSGHHDENVTPAKHSASDTITFIIAVADMHHCMTEAAGWQMKPESAWTISLAAQRAEDEYMGGARTGDAFNPHESLPMCRLSGEF
jgi:hypothetical protein